MREQAEFFYELRPINLFNLHPREASSVLDNFISFLNSLTESITFFIVRDEREVHAGGDVYDIPYRRYFISSPVQVDHLIEILRTRFVRVSSVPQLRIQHNHARLLIDDDSTLIQVFNVIGMTSNLSAGFLTQIYPIVHEIRIEIQPIELFDARKIAREHALSVGSRIIIRQNEGRSVDPEEQIEYQRAKTAAELIAARKERLFKVRVIIAICAKTEGELKEQGNKLRQILPGSVGEIDSPRWLQYPLYSGKGPRWARGRCFYMPTSSSAVFFPFAGLDVVDPNGVFLGENLQTGNVIIYDLFEKENYNIAVMGSPGLGKSTLIKTLMSRMILQNEDMMLYVFDSVVKPEYAVGPDGSYENSFAGITKSEVHRYSLRQGAGLDPFRVFEDNRRAANFIACIAKLEDEPELMADLYLAAQKSDGVMQLLSNSPPALLRRLEANLPAYRFLFEGETKFYDKMVFVLNDVPNSELRDAAAFLALSAVWRLVKRERTARRKAIVIDEGWSLVERNPRTGRLYFPMAAEYVPEIARTGRHYNTCFLIATQLVSDFMGRAGEYGPGRPMVESCATKIVLRQDQAASFLLKEALQLSDEEERFVLNAEVGKGLLITREGHLLLYNVLSEFERRLFTTTPKEVMV